MPHQIDSNREIHLPLPHIMSFSITARPMDYEKIAGSTLVIPAVSIGNIPQLAADLLLHNFGFLKVGTLLDMFLYPYISGVDHLETQNPPLGVLFALEVYHSEKLNVTLVQQRSPIIPGMAKAHVEQVLRPFNEKAGFSSILIMDLADAGLEEQMVPIRLFTNGSVDLLLGKLHILGSDVLHLGIESLDTLPGNLDVSTVKYVDALSSTPTSVVVSYVYEGDNSHDAYNMASAVARILMLDEPKWEKPVSWFGVYGDRPVPTALEEGLYG